MAMYVNIAVKDLEKSVRFFEQIGFAFKAKFTDENAACLIVGDDSYVMLLTENYFSKFISGRKQCSEGSSEMLLGFTVNTKDEVNLLVEKVIAAGGKEFRETTDHGWMYSRAFIDLDGHVWEVFYMDESKMPEE